MLDENDQLWVSLRHAHIAECIDRLLQQFNTFLSENKAASSSSGKDKNVASLKDLKDTLAAIPEFQELKSKFSTHISIAQECMALFERSKAAKVANVEQVDVLLMLEPSDGRNS